jgi:hypothetical protein
MRNSRRNSLSAPDRSAEAGSIAVPLLILSVVLGGAAISSLIYAMLWRGKAATQLRLDRCVEDASSELVRVQDLIEATNLRMKAERAAAAAAAIPTYGQSLNAVKPVLLAEAAIEEAARIAWTGRQAEWIARRGCDSRNDLLAPLPNLKWVRPLPDSIGAQPLAWEGSTRIVIRLWKTNRFSQAQTERSENGNWKSAWIPRLEH